jgi:hypothetical protein
MQILAHLVDGERKIQSGEREILKGPNNTYILSNIFRAESELEIPQNSLNSNPVNISRRM